MRLHKTLKKILLVWCAITILSGIDGVTSSRVDRK
jgi:hypothetical protein